MNSNENMNEEWVCLREDDDSRDGLSCSIVGNRAGIRRLGEQLIELSNSDNDSIPAPEFVNNYHPLLSSVLIVSSTFEEFTVADSMPEQKNNWQGRLTCAVLIMIGIITVLGLLNGLHTLYYILF